MKSGSLTPIILLVLLGAFFYFVVLRPQRRKQAEAASMQRTLAPGVEVMTTAGLYGTVVDIADDVVTLEVSPGVTHRYVRAAIAKVVPTPSADAGDGDHERIDEDYDDVPDHEEYPEVGDQHDDEAAEDDLEDDTAGHEHDEDDGPRGRGTA